MALSTKTKDIAALVAWLAISFAISAIGAAASINAKSFYSQLTQPHWAPPAWLFGPVWTVLFILIGISAWLVWRSGSFHNHRKMLCLFLAQLIANALWSWLFFAWQLGWLAFVEIVLLWSLIVTNIVSFWSVRPLAGVLFVPYLLWVSFAAALSYALWQINPQILG